MSWHILYDSVATLSAMRWAFDAGYLFAATLGLPIWMPRMVATGKIRTDWAARLGRAVEVPQTDQPRLMIHAVSVGEVNAIRLLVDELASEPAAPQIVISVTTDTGFGRAVDVFGDRHTVVRYPFDFSWAVHRFLNAVRPDAVALTELEVWPNFTAACKKRGIPLAVINGRLSERSFGRYRRIRPLVRQSFVRLAAAGVQNEAYANRFREMGTPEQLVHVTGNMKWDTAQIADDVPGADAMAESMGIDRSRPLIVAGSTAPTEHELLVASTPVGAQLLCAPRKPEWFDQAATALPGCARRSTGERGSATGRFLLDTIGELRAAYALADVVVVGRSFVDLFGSDMVEPVALGKATIVGPRVGDFQEMADALLEGDGLVQADRNTLKSVIADLLAQPGRRRQLGEQGRAVIREHQGATAKNRSMLMELLTNAAATPQARLAK